MHYCICITVYVLLYYFRLLPVPYRSMQPDAIDCCIHLALPDVKVGVVAAMQTEMASMCTANPC